jgi:hypothetical protein
MSPFMYDDGAYRATWIDYEIIAFAAMIRATTDMIQNGETSDKVRQKLLPPLSKDDAVAQEFSRLAGAQIADTKLQNLEQFGLALVQNLHESNDEALTEVAIPESEVKVALQALTAIRVYLGAKLEIETDKDSEILFNLLQLAADNFEESHNSIVDSNIAREQQMFLASIFFASGFVQESLLEALTGAR